MSETGLATDDLTTPRLRLRPLRFSDAGLIGLFAGDARVARMTTGIPHPYPPGGAEAFVVRARTASRPETVWALDTGSDAENGLVGVISLRPASDGSAEIGYWVAPAFWGTGYASEAVEAVADAARHRGFAVLAAQVFQDNPASIKVLTRAGFDYVGDGATHSVARNGMVETFRYRRPLGG